jgi:diguanylate cyclase (GGDEF)-like protein
MFSPGEKLERLTRQMTQRKNARLESARGGFLLHTKDPITGKDIVCTKDDATPEILRHARKLNHILDDEMLAIYLTVISERDGQKLKTDELTNIANLYSFNETLEGAIEELETSKLEAIVVIALDLNKFKKINDVYGHSAGDKALQAFANRLKTATRTNEYPFRKGGDEFAMILKIKDKEYSSDEAIEKTFENIKSRINENLFVKVEIRGVISDIKIESAMGYSRSRKGDNKNAEQLFREADEMAISAKGHE